MNISQREFVLAYLVGRLSVKAKVMQIFLENSKEDVFKFKREVISMGGSPSFFAHHFPTSFLVPLKLKCP